MYWYYNVQTNFQLSIFLISQNFQTTLDTDTAEILIEQPTEQTERLRPKDVASDAKIASFKTQVVTGESVTQEVDTKPEKHRADVEQSLLGSSQSTVGLFLSHTFYLSSPFVLH